MNIKFPDLKDVFPTSMGSLIDFRTKITDLIIIIATLAFIIAIVIGGFQYITSAGNEEQQQKAKNTLLYAVIGIVVVSLARVTIAWIEKQAK